MILFSLLSSIGIEVCFQFYLLSILEKNSKCSKITKGYLYIFSEPLMADIDTIFLTESNLASECHLLQLLGGKVL